MAEVNSFESGVTPHESGYGAPSPVETLNSIRSHPPAVLISQKPVQRMSHTLHRLLGPIIGNFVVFPCQNV